MPCSRATAHPHFDQSPASRRFRVGFPRRTLVRRQLAENGGLPRNHSPSTSEPSDIKRTTHYPAATAVNSRILDAYSYRRASHRLPMADTIATIPATHPRPSTAIHGHHTPRPSHTTAIRRSSSREPATATINRRATHRSGTASSLRMKRANRLPCSLPCSLPLCRTPPARR